MKRAILKGPRELEFEDIDLDAGTLADNEIYAETEYSAVSTGTELAAFLGHPPLRPGPVYPRLLGYCNAARVVDVGAAVEEFASGDRILTHQSHQSAFICASDRVIAPVPTGVSSRTATVAYLAQLGFAALKRAGLMPGDNVAVLGLGVIGLATVGVAASWGANVLAIGNDDRRQRMAGELGASSSLRHDAPDLQDRIAAATSGAGVDILVTTANPWDAWQTALDITKYGSRIAVLGFPGRTEGAPRFNPFDSARFYQKNLTVFSIGPPSSTGMSVAPEVKRNAAILLRWMREGRIDLDRLVTHCVPWRQLGHIYQLAAEKDRRLVAAVLDWNG